MRDLAERRPLCTAAAKASQANCGEHPCEILASQSGLRGCRFSSLKNCPPDLLDANPRRGRPCAGLTENPTAFVLDIRVRHRVPPPSMPRYVVPFVPMKS